MKETFLATFILILMSVACAFSQDAEKGISASSYGYVFGAPSVGISFCDCGNIAAVALGAGAEGILKGGFGLGVDGGHFFSPSFGAQNGIGLVSPSALYQFKTKVRTNPFVLGGYTLAFRDAVANLTHFGGGINYWLSQHWGLRLEVRYLMSPQYPSEAGALQFRVGALIR